MTDRAAPAIVIIGGGFTGAAVAYHLAAGGAAAHVHIIVVEPRAMLGGGVAYSSDDSACRINVPATRMSLIPEDGDHFLRWLKQDGALDYDLAALRPDGNAFPQRSVFGRYIASHVVPFLRDGSVRHVEDRAVAIHATGGAYRIELASGATLAAELLIIATTHPPPLPPRRLAAALAHHPRFVADPTAPGALRAIRPDDRVLIVGTGLTMADVVASLDAAGHRGPITAISRRGLRSRGHATAVLPAIGDFSTDPARSARALLQRIRAEVDRAVGAGATWHPVLDAVRSQGGAIWAALPLAERRRLIRHLRPYWDTHRFRVAPQIEDVLDRRIAEGTLTVIAASIAGADRDGDAILMTLRPRRSGTLVYSVFDAVVVTTGPAHGAILASELALRSLADAGIIKPDPAGLGIAVDSDGHALRRNGAPSDNLLIAGPLARGTFGELMGLPEVSLYARRIAEEAGLWVKRQRGFSESMQAAG